jgi:hypothetical protein
MRRCCRVSARCIAASAPRACCGAWRAGGARATHRVRVRRKNAKALVLCRDSPLVGQAVRRVVRHAPAHVGASSWRRSVAQACALAPWPPAQRVRAASAHMEQQGATATAAALQLLQALTGGSSAAGVDAGAAGALLQALAAGARGQTGSGAPPVRSAASPHASGVTAARPGGSDAFVRSLAGAGRLSVVRQRRNGARGSRLRRSALPQRAAGDAPPRAAPAQRRSQRAGTRAPRRWRPVSPG